MLQINNQFQTNSPVALITGSAAPRVGQAVARSLAQKGFQIAVHGNKSNEAGHQFVRELESAKVFARYFCADLEKDGNPKKLVQDVVGEFGRIDVVINSAAIWYPTPFDQCDSATIERFLRINCTASFLVSQQAGLVMAQQPTGGVVINVGDWAICRPYTDYPAYFLSKGSLPTMTRMLAVELAERNRRIRVNAVMPGPVMIPQSISEDKRQGIIDATLLKREGSAENVAHACVFLVENDFVTGVCLPVDGGRTVYSPFNPV